jgi:hypothetical protein
LARHAIVVFATFNCRRGLVDPAGEVALTHFT